MRVYVSSEHDGLDRAADHAPKPKQRAGVTVVAAAACDSTAYDRIEQEVASAIHNNHSAPPGLAVPCFLCRRDARAVMERLRSMGFGVVVASAAMLAAVVERASS